jgi:hypothetical protein
VTIFLKKSQDGRGFANAAYTLRPLGGHPKIGLTVALEMAIHRETADFNLTSNINF